MPQDQTASSPTTSLEPEKEPREEPTKTSVSGQTATLNPSTQPKHPKSHKNLLPIVVILILLFLASLATSIYFIIKSANQSSEISSLKNQLSDQTTIIIDDENPNNSDNSNDSTPDPSKPTITKEELLAKIPASLTFTANNKCLNHEGYSTEYHIQSPFSYSTGIELDRSNVTIATFNYSTNTPHLQINWDGMKNFLNFYGISNQTKSGEETITDFGLSGKPIDMIYVNFSTQSPGYDYLLFLLEDGSVEYVSFKTAFQTNNFHSQGKLPNIENVIKLNQVRSTETNCQNYCPSMVDVLAQRADGSYYSIIDTLEPFDAHQ